MRGDTKAHGHFDGVTIGAALGFAVALLIAVDAAVLLTRYSQAQAVLITWSAAVLLAAVGMLQAARALADLAVEDVLGDVQVYMTHDCNAEFFAIRPTIIDTVTDALLGA